MKKKNTKQKETKNRAKGKKKMREIKETIPRLKIRAKKDGS